MATQHRSSFAEIRNYRSHRTASFCDLDSSERHKRSCDWYAQSHPFERKHKSHRKGSGDSDSWHSSPVFDLPPDASLPADDSCQTADPDRSKLPSRNDRAPLHSLDKFENRSIEENDVPFGCESMLQVTAMDVDGRSSNDISFSRERSGTTMPEEVSVTDANQTCIDVSNKFELRSSSGRSARPLVDVTNKFELKSVSAVKRQMEEGDIHRLCQRQKQIEYGKNTSGYERYMELVPKSKRKSKDPQTPNPKQICSKRSWDGQIRKWRRLLHNYDPPIEAGAEEAEDFSSFMRRGNPDDYDTNIVNGNGTCRSIGDEEVQQSNNRSLTENLELSIYEDWVEP